MSDFYVGQKVVVSRNFFDDVARDGGYKKGDIITVSYVDSDGDPSFEGDDYQEVGWDSHDWFTPITTAEPKLELTQIRINGRLYNLVPVKTE